MDKKVQDDAGELPYAELVIRGGDSRPVVISSAEPEGKVDISPGTSEDMLEAKRWLEMMVQVVTAAYNVRRLSEANQKMSNYIKTGDDDIPF